MNYWVRRESSLDCGGKMPYHEIVFQVYEFVFLLGVLTIAALLIFAGFVSVLVDLAINRLVSDS